MRTTFDFSPLFRSSIGFDRVLDLLENASRVQAFDNRPPYETLPKPEQLQIDGLQQAA